MTTPVDRRLLPKTMTAFFGRFDRLTDIQEEAIPLILAGHDVLMCSATASGKTEAFAAPAAEMALRHDTPSASTVIVAPTRALANDLRRRLTSPMHQVETSIGRYTGEHKELNRGQLPAVVITTPEALDSMLARRPSSLSGVRFIVLDEIHILDNTPRGDQLRILLHRLEALAPRRPQRIAASATVEHRQELADRYLCSPRIVVAQGIRKIRGRPLDGVGVRFMARHIEGLAEHGFKKLLVFCRSRNEVEEYAAGLHKGTRFGDQIYAHHGSLSRTSRLRTERLFREAAGAVCFATLTLEMGIDIGTVDYVVLANLPSNVASLLQRIGRGGRRGDETRAGYVVKDEAQRHVYETMFRLAARGLFHGDPYTFRPSVVAQQALVMACSQTFIEAKEIVRSLGPVVQTELPAGACRSILDSLVTLDLLEKRHDRYVAGAKIEWRYDRGVLHGNIADSPSIDVVDRLTGDIVGHVEMSGGNKVDIGGRSRRVMKQDENRILTDAAKGGQPAQFQPSGAPRVSFGLSRAVIEQLGVATDEILQVPLGGNFVLLHGLGTAGSILLAVTLKSSGQTTVKRSGPYVCRLAVPLKFLPQIDSDAIGRFVDEHLKELEKLISPGPWSHAIPRPLRIASTRRGIGVDEAATFLHRAQLRTLPLCDPAMETILRGL